MADVNEVAGRVLDKHIQDMQNELNQLRPLKPKPASFTFRTLVVAIIIAAVFGWVASCMFHASAHRRRYDWDDY